MTLKRIAVIAFFVTPLLGGLLPAAPARAHSYWDTVSRQENGDDFQPYIEHPFQTQNTQWDDDPWTPSAWAQQRKGGGQDVVRDFYQADILRKLYTRHDTPAVDVGPGFYTLSGNDQRRVAAMIDEVYGITKNKVFGMFTLYDWNNHRAIGTYTQYGLQMK